MDDIEEIQRLRDEYEAALSDADQRRDEYHRAIKKLHLSGVPLREIAEQLGVSHQRVHQIVTGQPAPRRRGGKAARTALATLALLSAVGVGVGGGYMIANDRPTPIASPPVASNLVSVPRVTGLPVIRAQQILQGNGVCVTGISAANGEASDHVASQSPPAGTLVPRLAGVSLEVPGPARAFSFGEPPDTPRLLPENSPLAGEAFGPPIAVGLPTDECGNELRVFDAVLRFQDQTALAMKRSGDVVVIEVRE